jgi:hypothetical protein
MSNVYLTFSGRAYDDTTKLIVDRAPRFGADRVIVADDAWLMTQPFYRDHQWLWAKAIAEIRRDLSSQISGVWQHDRQCWFSATGTKAELRRHLRPVPADFEGDPRRGEYLFIHHG